MLSRDLIATVVRTFFEELDDVRDGGQKGDPTALYADLYLSYFNKNREYFVYSDMTDVTAFFANDPIQKLEMLAELMYRDAKSCADTEIRMLMHKRTIELCEAIDFRSMEFSMERTKRLQELKNELKA